MSLLISVNSITKSYGPQPVIKDIGFNIDEGQKIGLIGQNGTGKTTLLNIIYGIERPDSGEIKGLSDKTLGYMTQHSPLDDTKTLIEAISKPTGKLGSLAKKITFLENKLENTGSIPPEQVEEISKEYATALEEFASSGGYGQPSRAEAILEEMRFTKRHFQIKISDLSGGERTKARLASILLEARGADLLLLDEPTNHLDIETTEWLEDYLAGYSGAVLMVSHDRYLMDKVISKVVELESCVSSIYSGNYSDYLEKKTFELEKNMKMYHKQQKEIKRQKEMIEWMHSTYSFSSLHKTQQKKLDKMDKLDRPQDHARNLRLSFGKAEKSGKDVVDAIGIKKSYGQISIIGKCDFRIEKGEKVGLIGPNGSGKTTLIRMVMGELSPTAGSIKVSKGTKIGYYAQEQDGLIRGNTVIQEIRKEKKDASEEWVRNYLGKFFFRGEDVFKKVFQLSGGERARLAIAKFLLAEHNMLILDEPTNYLDMYAKASVEKALADYGGTVMIITHDRAVLDNVADIIFDLKDGALTTFYGNYSEYRRHAGKAGLSTGGDVYEVIKKFTDWSSGKKYQKGERIRIPEGELDKYEWAIENKHLKKK
ncbi:MAG: ABC-F family ATP-binding cassette domain-containing protein [Thermoplasmata archaeon]|nr:ABC-F family ATP-binding cassette domain-containing protein [Thermoplasmata archaeon]